MDALYLIFGSLSNYSVFNVKITAKLTVSLMFPPVQILYIVLTVGVISLFDSGRCMVVSLVVLICIFPND